MKNGVSHERKYSLSRQLVYNVPDGGEACWVLREALLAAFTTHHVEIKGVSDLKVRVEEHPVRRDKRLHFFRALNALEKQIPRDTHEANNIIVDMRLLRMYAGSEHVPLGEVSVTGWTWSTVALNNTLADKLDVLKLRRESLLDSN